LQNFLKSKKNSASIFLKVKKIKALFFFLFEKIICKGLIFYLFKKTAVIFLRSRIEKNRSSTLKDNRIFLKVKKRKKNSVYIEKKKVAEPS
jgi:hypothetical protein